MVAHCLVASGQFARVLQKLSKLVLVDQLIHTSRSSRSAKGMHSTSVQVCPHCEITLSLLRDLTCSMPCRECATVWPELSGQHWLRRATSLPPARIRPCRLPQSWTACFATETLRPQPTCARLFDVCATLANAAASTAAAADLAACAFRCLAVRVLHSAYACRSMA